ncbi:uncharacterized protein [Nicotiana tomentosiformis]|uniref:uncharacterized protein n=1 Tax=Nicotiana tomentosiformis TaxID=4098 RepID=UPI00388CE3A4
MLAHKVVAGREQIKKINEKLKAGREEEPKKYDESFKSATDGEETVSSETEQVSSGSIVTPETISEITTNLENRFVLVGSMAGVEIIESGEVGGKMKKEKKKKSKGVRSAGEESAGIEESVKKTGGSGSGEATEGLVQLGKNVDEPRKSQKKKSEAELKKALEESKRKDAAKGKKKVSELVEAVEIDEIDLVLRDEDETAKVEVLTPKAKKAKTSTKKSVSKSAVKSRQVNSVEEEEWSGEKEDDSNTEKDKMAKFGKRTILKGRLLGDLEGEGMVLLLEKL